MEWVQLINDGSGVYLLEKLDLLSKDLGFNEYTSGSKSVLDIFCITLALMVGTAGLPHVIVRFFTVKELEMLENLLDLAFFFITILYTTAPAVSVFSKLNLIDTVSEKEYSSMPEWFKNWENTGLIVYEDKNNDGIINYNNSSNNELIIDNDIMVLANPEIANLPAWVIALVAAGGLAAALSTAAGLLLVISTSVSNDLLKKFLCQIFHKKMNY